MSVIITWRTRNVDRYFSRESCLSSLTSASVKPDWFQTTAIGLAIGKRRCIRQGFWYSKHWPDHKRIRIMQTSYRRARLRRELHRRVATQMLRAGECWDSSDREQTTAACHVVRWTPAQQTAQSVTHYSLHDYYCVLIRQNLVFGHMTRPTNTGQ